MTTRGGISGIGQRKPRIRRDWQYATAKVEAERYRCRNWRVCLYATDQRAIERAHIIGREHDGDAPVRARGVIGAPAVIWRPYVVHPDRIIPLCSYCHREQHARRLDLLPLLAYWEQIQAVADAGSIATAYTLLMPSENRKRVG